MTDKDRQPHTLTKRGVTSMTKHTTNGCCHTGWKRQRSIHTEDDAGMRESNPVIILHSKHTAPLMWKVVCGFSQMYFRSFSEAVEFCNSRGFQLVKAQVE